MTFTEKPVKQFKNRTVRDYNYLTIQNGGALKKPSFIKDDEFDDGSNVFNEIDILIKSELQKD